jgi:quercetin dioxygenase-like cupin family protein
MKVVQPEYAKWTFLVGPLQTIFDYGETMEKEMKISRTSFPLAISSLVLLAFCPTRGQSPPAQTRVVITQEMPPFDGNHIKVTGVEVTYPPGGSSQPHTHGCPVLGYIAEGAIRYQVKGQPETIYKAGDSFYEASNGVHRFPPMRVRKSPPA